MAKRSRRERRLDVEKQKQITPKAAPAESPAAEMEAPLKTEVFSPEVTKPVQVGALNNRKAAVINFAHEYFYVYHELTTILIITAIMFAVMVGLAFVI